MIELKKYREDFLILRKKVRGRPIIYFDNACMALKPIQVINKLNEYYNEYPACGGRSQHQLGIRVTEETEETRRTAAKFLSAKKPSEIIFTRNTTESINLVANSLGLKEGDKVLTSDREHNSNLVPWHMQKAQHETMPSNKDGTFSMDSLNKKLTKKVKLISVVHTSNLDGYTLPIKEITKAAHDNGTLVLIDAAQSAPHKEVNAKKLDVDFLACSGHKMLGPTGTGMLYGKEDALEKLKPFIVGGETVTDSTYNSQTFEKVPNRFEAGLQDYAGIIGLGEALRYLNKVGMNEIEAHEQKLGELIRQELSSESKIELINPEAQKSGICSFNIKGLDPHMIVLTLDKTANIMTRSGHHCVHSWFNAHKINGSARASLYFYNTKEECEQFCEEVKKIAKHFA